MPSSLLIKCQVVSFRRSIHIFSMRRLCKTSSGAAVSTVPLRACWPRKCSATGVSSLLRMLERWWFNCSRSLHPVPPTYAALQVVQLSREMMLDESHVKWPVTACVLNFFPDLNEISVEFCLSAHILHLVAWHGKPLRQNVVLHSVLSVVFVNY